MLGILPQNSTEKNKTSYIFIGLLPSVVLDFSSALVVHAS